MGLLALLTLREELPGPGVLWRHLVLLWVPRLLELGLELPAYSFGLDLRLARGRLLGWQADLPFVLRGFLDELSRPGVTGLEFGLDRLVGAELLGVALVLGTLILSPLLCPLVSLSPLLCPLVSLSPLPCPLVSLRILLAHSRHRPSGTDVPGGLRGSSSTPRARGRAGAEINPVDGFTGCGPKERD